MVACEAGDSSGGQWSSVVFLEFYDWVFYVPEVAANG